jgi:hypothetical protein
MQGKSTKTKPYFENLDKRIVASSWLLHTEDGSKHENSNSDKPVPNAIMTQHLGDG